jgi:hypothetical protein
MVLIRDLIKFSRKGMKLYFMPYFKKKKDLLEHFKKIDLIFSCGIIFGLETLLRFGLKYISNINADLYRKNLLSLAYLPFHADLINLKLLNLMMEFGFSAFIVEPNFIQAEYIINKVKEENVGLIIIGYTNGKIFDIDTIRDKFMYVDGLFLDDPSNEILSFFTKYAKPILVCGMDKKTYSILYKN